MERGIRRRWKEEEEVGVGGRIFREEMEAGGGRRRWKEDLEGGDRGRIWRIWREELGGVGSRR
jgi:hypothetical protein